MPHRARRKSKAGQSNGSTASKPSLFLFLPPTVLDHVFAEPGTVTFDNFLICRRLLPATLANLYRAVQLDSADALALFASAIERQPWLVSRVHELELAILDECDYLLPKRSLWLPGGGRAEQAILNCTDRRKLSTLKMGPDLLRELCRRLSRLDRLHIVGAPIFRLLTARTYLETDPFPSLTRLRLIYAQDPALLCEDAPEEGDDTLLSRLQLIPTVCAVTLENMWHVPIDLLGCSPMTQLASRTFSWKAFTLSGFYRIGPELRCMFRGLSSSLRSVQLFGYEPYANIWRDLVVLPRSLEHLDVGFGYCCPVQCPTDPPPLPKLENLPWVDFPNLQHLHLGGDVVSALTFSTVLLRLPRLFCLSLNEHVDIPTDSLFSLLRGGPSTWPRIRRLSVNICACERPVPPAPAAAAPPPPQTRRKASRAAAQAVKLSRGPHWPREFGKAEALELLRITAAREIGLMGSVLCAEGACTDEDGHTCPEWDE
ncbi:uncharacterized protein JCM10292_003759 [Rhodotorula paludigena]|uniref:uncharacterized protein n=1 Tax=Rhodotorula paludigena TaxID=86838 RepID=UPI003180BE13